jgi:hypothetical protein
MTDFEDNKLYILGVVGSGLISKRIQHHSFSNLVPPCERFSHVAVLYRDEVVESHLKKGGVVKLPFSGWCDEQKREGNKAFVFWYHEFNHAQSEAIFHACESMAYAGVKYGAGDIRNFLIESSFSWDLFLKDKGDGLVCSQLISYTDYNHISEYMNLPRRKIKPVHFQEYAIRQEIELKEIL